MKGSETVLHCAPRSWSVLAARVHAYSCGTLRTSLYCVWCATVRVSE